MNQSKSKIVAVILAAGEGKRMKSKKSKVLQQVGGRAMIDAVIEAATGAGADEVVVVVGHMADQVIAHVGTRAQCVFQHERLGTGHAVLQAKAHFGVANATTDAAETTVLVLCGDTPIITKETLKKMLDTHRRDGNSGTFMTAITDNPFAYGRIVRGADGAVLKIVEEVDCTPEEAKIKELNSGMYCFKGADLLMALSQLGNNNNQGEYYLTDTLEILNRNHKRCGAYVVEEFDETMGVNDRSQLAVAEAIIRRRCAEKHMTNGVSIIDPLNTYIAEDAVIGMDTVIYPGTIIDAGVTIGEDCVIGPQARLTKAKIGDGVTINQSTVIESEIGDETKIGPFAYIRPNCKIGKGVKIGDFVEVKNATIGDKCAISHLTYVGDSDVGRNVNIGCGVVFVNYDGQQKHRSTIADNCFIGCNTNLVSPIQMGEGAYTAAGSTITEDVPAFALAIARERQVNKLDWVKTKGKVRKEK
ncbi:MAG: bifunctional UDP-N-acetylglucosamine diphosphorylase/glucosamine-1-phosphate N-acetyltransferase GlmU [Clostridia bacterium]